MSPWKVFGFDKYVNDNGDECVRLFVARPLDLAEGHTGDGCEVRNFFYKPKYVPGYEPALNQLIVPVEGRYGINQIFVVGMDKVA